MWEGTERIEIAARPEEVWAVVGDVSRHKQLAGSGEIQELRVNGPIAKGATWEADERIRGAGAFTAQSECLVYDPPREFSWKSFPPPMKKDNMDSVPDITWWYRLEPKGDGTLLEHSFRVAEPKSGGLLLRVFYGLTGRARAIRKGMRQTLVNVKAAVEEAKKGPAETSS